MKHLFSRFILPALFVLCGGLTGCSEDNTEQEKPQPQPPKEEATASIKTVETVSGSNAVILTTENITEYAYLCEVKAEGKKAPTAAVIFATGTTGKCDASGETRIEIKDVLEPGTSYVVYIALKTTENEYFANVLEADLTPAAYDESEMFQVLQELPDGYVVRINLPQSVKDANNVLRYVCRNIVVDNYYKYNDFLSMLTNGGFFLDKSTTITMDNDHIVERDENGEPVIDPDTGDVVTIADPMVPGEPLYMSIGEYGWGESIFGWGEGWYIPQFDTERWQADQGLSSPSGLSTRAGASLVLSGEEDYWTGAYGKYRFSTAKPDTMTASVKLELSDLRPNDATLTLRPEEGVDRYCVLVLPHSDYLDCEETLLNKEPELWQWFATSLICNYLYVSRSAVDAIQFNLSDLFYASVLNPGVPFHVMITAMKDRDREKDGMIQSFKHEIFELPERTKPAPEIIVTPLPEKCTPYQIFFNIKAPNRDAYMVRTLLNYEREWLAMLNKGNSYSSMTAAYGVLLSSEMVAQVNSDEGLEISYSSRPDAVSILAVHAENDEGLGNNLDAEGSPAVVRLRSARLPELPRVESDLFERLNGDWTATATVEHTDLKTGEKSTMEMSTKVTISNGLTYEETLKDWVYYLYPTQTKEWVDALYADFKAETDNFNENLTRRNMMLCMGFDFDSNKMGYLTPALPFDLFTSTTYSSTNNAGLFYDFGPKWYLQVRPDGSVVAPINFEDYAPLSDWFDEATYYLVGWDKDNENVIMRNHDTSSDDRDAYFPVTVSEDRNTITINPMVQDGKTYYMTPAALGINSGTGATYAQSIGTIVKSSIVLTRGYTEPAQPAATSAPKKYVPGSSLNSKRPQGRSVFVPEQPAARRIECEKVPTKEERDARMKAYIERFYGRK